MIERLRVIKMTISCMSTGNTMTVLFCPNGCKVKGIVPLENIAVADKKTIGRFMAL